MTTSIKNKMRKVMQLAHRAYQLKSSSMSWVECLKQAWQVVKLEAAMKTKVVEFFFMKMHGDNSRLTTSCELHKDIFTF